MCVWVDGTINMCCAICIQCVYHLPQTETCWFFARTQRKLCIPFRLGFLCSRIAHLLPAFFCNFSVWTDQCLLSVHQKYGSLRVRLMFVENWFTVRLVWSANFRRTTQCDQDAHVCARLSITVLHYMPVPTLTELYCVTSVHNTVPFHTTIQLECYVDVRLSICICNHCLYSRCIKFYWWDGKIPTLDGMSWCYSVTLWLVVLNGAPPLEIFN